MSKCYCMQPLVMKTSWTDTNPGRRFKSCARYQEGGCNYFEWVDPPMCNRCRDIIPGLLRRTMKAEREVDILSKLVKRVERAESEVDIIPHLLRRAERAESEVVVLKRKLRLLLVIGFVVLWLLVFLSAMQVRIW